MLRRDREPFERLTKINEGEKTGRCNHCLDGLVVIMREAGTLRLRPDACMCANCGQRYYLMQLDLERFLGYPPEKDPFL